MPICENAFTRLPQTAHLCAPEAFIGKAQPRQAHAQSDATPHCGRKAYVRAVEPAELHSSRPSALLLDSRGHNGSPFAQTTFQVPSNGVVPSGPLVQSGKYYDYAIRAGERQNL